MRLDTFGTLGDFIIHAIALSFYTVAWIIPISLFWFYVIYPDMCWPIFFPYFLVCFLSFRYAYTPFLALLRAFWKEPVIAYFFVFFFSCYFIFFCYAFFDFFQNFEKNQKSLHFKIIQNEENIFTENLKIPIFHFFLFNFIPCLIAFVCLFTFLHFSLKYHVR